MIGCLIRLRTSRTVERSLCAMLVLVVSVGFCFSDDDTTSDHCLVFDWATSPNGDQIAVIGDQLVLYSTETGEMVRKFETFIPWGRSIHHLHWKDHRTLCTWAPKQQCPVSIDVLSGATSSLVRSPRKGDEIGPAYFSPNGQMFSCQMLSRRSDEDEGTLSLAVYSVGGELLRSLPVRTNIAGWTFVPITWSDDSSHVYLPCASDTQGTDVIEINTIDMSMRTVFSLEELVAGRRPLCVDNMAFDRGRLFIGSGRNYCYYMVEKSSGKTKVFSSAGHWKQPPSTLFVREKMLCALTWGESFESNSIVVFDNMNGGTQRTVWSGPAIRCHWGNGNDLEFITSSRMGVTGLYSLNCSSFITRQLLSEAALRRTILSE